MVVREVMDYNLFEEKVFLGQSSGKKQEIEKDDKLR